MGSLGTWGRVYTLLKQHKWIYSKCNFCPVFFFNLIKRVIDLSIVSTHRRTPSIGGCIVIALSPQGIDSPLSQFFVCTIANKAAKNAFGRISSCICVEDIILFVWVTRAAMTGCWAEEDAHILIKFECDPSGCSVEKRQRWRVRTEVLRAGSRGWVPLPKFQIVQDSGCVIFCLVQHFISLKIRVLGCYKQNRTLEGRRQFWKLASGFPSRPWKNDSILDVGLKISLNSSWLFLVNVVEL